MSANAKESAYREPLRNHPKYIEANAQLDAKDYTNALKNFDLLLKTFTDSAGIYYGRAKAHHEQGNKKSAFDDYTRSINLNKSSPKALNNRALIYAANGDLKSAISDLGKAIILNPKYDHAYSNRGVAKGATGDPQGAMADFSKAIEINPLYGAAWRNRGITKELLGDVKGACKDWKRAANLGIKECESWLKAQCNEK